VTFDFPVYTPPDFAAVPLAAVPCVRFAPVVQEGIAPDGYHATSVYPEYFQLAPGSWTLLQESRMDCVVVLDRGGALQVQEFRTLKIDDRVACGRSEDGSDGILVYPGGFSPPGEEGEGERFTFRSRFSRETSFSIDYDRLYALLEHERRHGFILWVLGPVVVFDRDAREAFAALVDGGYVHALFAGNALPTHDLEGALFGTALGQDLYTKRPAPQGHYRHLDALNRIRALGSIRRAVEEGEVRDGVMRALVEKGIPFVLAGSIRDDGPLPEVIADACQAQDQMRTLARKATTVIALATALHTIATGNMVPSYRVESDGLVRPVYFYAVDMSEFALGKLLDRGSVSARPILTNVQDFIVTLQRGLGRR
jgi:lysine-ketoglutarate reductase/saccharopine dehydrogenase-like protein (TIGR00300 family)